MIKAGKVVVDGADIPVEIYFCGDLQYKQMVLGLKGSIATYGSVSCKVAKDDRWKTDKEQDILHQCFDD